MSWIEVDRKGLAQVIADRPKSFLLFELIQNSLDEPGVTKIDVSVAMHPETRGRAIVIVRDDSPDGYQDIRHAWTMFAPSKKKGDAELRGRFNLGCKLVLALAVEACVISTKSAVRFTAEGRRLSRERRDAGTEFQGVFRMSKADVEEALEEARNLLPPAGVTVTINEVPVEAREPFATAEKVTLPTVLADEEGVLRRTSRQTTIELHEPADGEVPMLFEMGIPVVELDGDDPWHVNVLQRVPLNTDRDNVTPAYLCTLRVEVLNAAHDRLDKEQATAVWATEASEDERATDDAVGKVLDERFGKKRVAYDPSDPEANSRATAAGYTVVPGGSMTSGQWRNAKGSGRILPAGQVTPSQKVRSAPDGVPALEGEKWTEAMHEIAGWARFLANALGVCDAAHVAWYGGREANLWKWSGAWGEGGSLSLNKPKLGHEIRAWEAGDREPMCRLLIHEFAHEKVDDHLSDRFHEECIRLAVRLSFLGLSVEELTGVKD